LKKEFVCMAFSSDAKYIITQSGAPEWMLYYWTWEKTKLMASVKTANVPGEKFGGLNATGEKGALSATSANFPIPGGIAGGQGKDVAFGGAIHQISFNPTDNTQLCVVGNGVFKLFRYSEGLLKPLTFPKVESRVRDKTSRKCLHLCTDRDIEFPLPLLDK
jgi:hypothetical protein